MTDRFTLQAWRTKVIGGLDHYFNATGLIRRNLDFYGLNFTGSPHTIDDLITVTFNTEAFFDTYLRKSKTDRLTRQDFNRVMSMINAYNGANFTLPFVCPMEPRLTKQLVDQMTASTQYGLSYLQAAEGFTSPTIFDNGGHIAFNTPGTWTTSFGTTTTGVVSPSSLIFPYGFFTDAAWNASSKPEARSWLVTLKLVGDDSVEHALFTASGGISAGVLQGITTSDVSGQLYSAADAAYVFANRPFVLIFSAIFSPYQSTDLTDEAALIAANPSGALYVMDDETWDLIEATLGFDPTDAGFTKLSDTFTCLV
jgi:hypothetical protein